MKSASHFRATAAIGAIAMPAFLPPIRHSDWRETAEITVRFRRFVNASLIAAAMLAMAVGAPAFAQPVELVAVDIKEVAEGYRVSELIGADVYNDEDDDIGEVNDVIMGKDKTLLAAILEVGGFLELGEWLIAVPFDSLEISDDGSKLTLKGGTKEALKAQPQYEHPQ
jgi:hypothetical protein